MTTCSRLPLIWTVAVSGALILLIACDRPPEPEAASGTPQSASVAARSADAPAAIFAPPTEAEVRQTIENRFREVYGESATGPVAERVSFDFGAIRIGTLTEKQMEYGELARPAYPVKAAVTISIKYPSVSEPRVVERGTASNDVFFFYRDSFGDWAFRTGSL